MVRNYRELKGGKEGGGGGGGVGAVRCVCLTACLQLVNRENSRNTIYNPPPPKKKKKEKKKQGWQG